MSDLPSSIRVRELQLIANGHDEDHTFVRGKSKIVFNLIDEPTYLWTEWNPTTRTHAPVGLMIDEIQHSGGDAAIEAEGGLLDNAVYSLLEPEDVSAGWWVVEGFNCHYIRGDGWMTDDDVDHYCDAVRPARWSDIAEFGIARTPWYLRLARLIGIDPVVGEVIF